MLVTLNIAFQYINILFRFLKQKVINIRNADIAYDTLEISIGEIQNDPTVSDTDDGNRFDCSAENGKSNRIQEVSCSSSNQLTLETGNVIAVNFVSYETHVISGSDCNSGVGVDINKISETNIRIMNEESTFEQNQNSSCVKHSTNTTSNSNSSEPDNQENANNTSKYYITESEFETDRGIRFYPPVYIQRYNSVRDVLMSEKLRGKIKKVVEFGCAEMTFFSLFLKRIYEIEEIIEVDIDRDVLNQYFHKVSPQASDYMKMRTTPLKVQLYEGSVAHTHACLSGSNAVICIELIEHLYPYDLEALPFTIFGFIRPQVAIFTTPNADFNVLFPGFSGFRHCDHKFEWTQEQFQSWANNLIIRYPQYVVSFKGIGKGPIGTEEYGCCSQMAVFYQEETEVLNIQSPLDNTIQAGEYKLLREYDFPVYVDLRTEEQKIRDNAVYYINQCRSMDRYELSPSSGIPLTAVLANVNCHSLAQLRGILERDSWNIYKNEYGELIVQISDPEREEFSDSDNGYCCESKATALQCFNSGTVQVENDEDWNEQCNSSNLSVNGSTKNVVDNTLRLDDNNGFWTTVNLEEYNPISGKQISDERVSMCVVKEEELLSDNRNVISELMMLNESETIISSDLPAVNVCKLHAETALDEDEIYYKPELTNYHSFGKSVYKTPPNFFCPQNTTYKSLSAKEEPVCDSTLIDTEPTKDSSVHVFCIPDHKEMPDLHNSDKENKICLSCKSVLQNCNLSCSSYEISHKQLDAEKVQTDTALICRHFEEQLDCNDVLESSESSEILLGLQDSCSACKAVDSGYPNTSSCQEMDMDLTPEQVDEILTENESSLNSAADYCGGVGNNEITSHNSYNDTDDCDDDSDDVDDHGNDGDDDDNGSVHDNNGDGDDIFEEILRPGSPVQFQVVPRGQNVENGDLVNNNQDNEGNNMIGQIDGEILEFEVQINENDDHPVLAAGEEYDEDRVNDRINDICKND